MKYIVTALLAVSLIVSCKTPNSELSNAAVNAAPLPNCASANNYCTVIDEARFNTLAADVSVGGEIQKVVKFVLDRRDRQKPVIYFFNTNTYAYHHDFVTNGLGINISLDKFNTNYAGDGQARDWNMT